jgi:hypothetical protein
MQSGGGGSGLPTEHVEGQEGKGNAELDAGELELCIFFS